MGSPLQIPPGAPSPDAAERTETLARRARAVADPALRVRYLRSVAADLPPTEVADVLLLAWTGAEARRPGHEELLVALVLGLHAEDGLRSAVAAAAVHRGHGPVALAMRPLVADDHEEGRGVVPERAGRPLTLGERKALARRVDRRSVDRALRDPHPDVLRILLGHPVLTEPDVVRLAARRDVPRSVLREVFLSSRWVRRPAVRRALVKNPRTPLAAAVALAPLLDAGDAREVASSPSLDARLRGACERARSTVH